MKLTMAGDGTREPRAGDVVMTPDGKSVYLVTDDVPNGSRRWTNLASGQSYVPGDVDGRTFVFAPKGTRVVLEV